MRRPDVTAPGRSSGTGAGEAGQASNLKTDVIAQGAIEIAQRRADALRLQALGQIGGAS